MPSSDLVNDLKQHGWTMSVSHAKAVAGEITYIHADLPDHRIQVPEVGDGWKHYDADGFLIGHSRLNTKLADHLRDRHQF